MTSSFHGFPPDLLRFLRELKANNDREWFNANKQRYREAVLEPMCEFISAMDAVLAKVSDCFVADPRPNGGSMFRIYRDVRFSHDKRPYKEHAACHFRHMAGKDAHAPGFYVHLEPDDVFFGGGIWLAPGPVLQRVREAIVDDTERWMEITGSSAFKRRFGGVGGEGLKRAPRGFDPDHPCIEDLKRKTFFAMSHVESGLATTDKFIKEVEKTFLALGPFLEFLTHASGHVFSLED
ncbi:MAG: DUF2461 domain-containing protein [Myxococcales bacterium]|nr:MAG: DUF2461 domain-containing protein [Myxococcales bacterium]